jgi:DNA-binding transcriptional ArsR family regulator
MPAMVGAPLHSAQDFGQSRKEWTVVVVLRFGARDLLRCRFAQSPLHETIAAIRVLGHAERQPYHLPWLRRVVGELGHLDLAPLLALTGPRTYNPDFLSPPPSGPLTVIDEELELVGATPPGQVRAEIDRWLAAASAPPPPVLLGDPAAVRDLLVERLWAAWHILVEPWWPQLRDLLQADITYRARRFADGGMAAVLGDLHPRVRWREGDNTLEVELSVDGTYDLDGAGLVLLPGAFEWPSVGLMVDPPWQPTLDYPARGIAGLWQAPTGDRDLARLLGATRARLLLALAEPASTTGLAARCQLPVSTVSEHLSVLRAAGLVATSRSGRQLEHRQTPLGITLCASPGTA